MKKFAKFITILFSIFAMFASIGLAAVLIMSDVGLYDILTNEVRTYTVQYFNEDQLMYECSGARGEPFTYEGDEPTKDTDANGQIYIFIGWDITGEGIPDIMPTAFYSNIKAKACYFKFGIPDIDWTKVDLYELLDLLESLNIDIESFANMFGLDLDDLAQLAQTPIMYIDSNYSLPSYFRTESYADYNMKKKKWSDAGYYDANLISPGSVNPLCFAADKIATKLNNGGYRFEVEYLKKGEKYPVVDYEIENNEHLNSESYSCKTVDSNMKHTSYGYGYIPLNTSTVTALQLTPFTSSAISNDEEVYREFAYDNYLNVDEVYSNYFNELVNELKTEKDYSKYFKNLDELNHYKRGDLYTVIDGVNKYFTSNMTFNYAMTDYPTDQDPLLYFLKESHEGIGRHFAGATTLFFRSLGIPARYVQGYFSLDSKVVYMLASHSWCEIYIDGVGWMMADTAIGAQYLNFDLFGNSISNEATFDFGDVSGKVASDGPGNEVADRNDVFTFTSDYEGTAYFRSRSFDSYDYKGEWSMKNTYNPGTSGYISPLMFAPKASERVFESNMFELTYKTNIKYAPIPINSSELLDNDGGELSKNDAYSLTDVEEDNTVIAKSYNIDTSAGSLATLRYVIDKNSTLKNQLMHYYDTFAVNHYLDVDGTYKEKFKQLAIENGLVATDGLGNVIQDDNILEKVQNFFQANYTYDVDFETYPDDVDPAYYFTFESKVGICNNFASAATLMFRSLDYPARYVVGYGAPSAGTGIINKVNCYTAHAWTEVFIDGVGWVNIDCTGFMDGHGKVTSETDDEGNKVSINDGKYGDGFGGGGYEGQYITHDGVFKLDKNYFTKNYDGMPAEFTADIVNYEGELTPGDHIEVEAVSLHPLYTDVGEFINVGTYPMKINVRVFNLLGENVTAERYFDKDVISFTANFKVTYRSITVTTLTMKVSYDSSSDDVITAHGIEDGINLAPNDYIDYDQLVFTSSRRINSKGSTDNVLDPTSIHIYSSITGNEVTSNYMITVENGKLIVE